MRTCEQDVDQLLRTKSAAANEAIAGLMCFYIGDDARDGLKCEAINRGRKIVPYLKKFLDAPPITGLEPIDPFFTNVPNFRRETLQRIEAGADSCIRIRGS